jgi:hypothetical protein
VKRETQSVKNTKKQRIRMLIPVKSLFFFEEKEREGEKVRF